MRSTLIIALVWNFYPTTKFRTRRSIESKNFYLEMLKVKSIILPLAIFRLPGAFKIAYCNISREMSSLSRILLQRKKNLLWI